MRKEWRVKFDRVINFRNEGKGMTNRNVIEVLVSVIEVYWATCKSYSYTFIGHANKGIWSKEWISMTCYLERWIWNF